MKHSVPHVLAALVTVACCTCDAAQAATPYRTQAAGTVQPVRANYYDYDSYYAQDEKTAPAENGSAPAVTNTSPGGCNDACNGCCESACEDSKYCWGPDEPWELYNDECCNFKIGGWTQFGYSSDNDGVFNTHPGYLDLQQGYLYAEKVADGSGGLGFGGRVDVLYGTDGPNTQAFGNNPGRWDYQNGFDHGVYGWAIPQAYAEVAYENLSVKVGHFYTLLGYQVVPATGNFFYSIPYTFNFSEAFTHTGALASYKSSENLTLYGGWTLGWDTGFDQFNQGNNFLGGASVKLTDDVTATYICTAGNLGWIGDDAYTHSFVVDWVINDKWEYVFQSDLNDIENSVNSDGGRYDTIGINQYLFYTISDTVRAGARVEWWKADGISVNEMAFGINIKPMANVIMRPEIRHNWVPGDTLPFVLPGPDSTAEDYLNNTIFGMDVILTF
jgi:hypothetical protein